MKNKVRVPLLFSLLVMGLGCLAQQNVTVISRCGGLDSILIPTIVDTDHDQMDDALEQRLLQWFCPQFIQFNDESCPGPALNGTGDSNLVVCHIYPFPQQYTKSASLDSVKTNPVAVVPKKGLYAGLIWYNPLIMVNAALLYGKDCGLSGHTADVEGFSYSLKYIGSDPAGWMYDTVLSHWQGGTVQTISHASTLCEQIETKASKRIAPFTSFDTIYASPDKHGNYLTISKCGSSFICNPGCGGTPSAKKVRTVNIGEPSYTLISDLGSIYAPYAGNNPWGTINFLDAQGGNAGAIRDKMIKSLTSDFAQGQTLLASQICPLYENCFGPNGSSFSSSICAGQALSFYGQSLSTSGVFTKKLTDVKGCDSTITLHLTVSPTYLKTNTAGLCAGDSLLFGGRFITISGLYSDTLHAISGCDSIIQLQVNGLVSPRTSLNKNICVGESYLFGGVSIGVSGLYSDTLTANSGCDSIIILSLHVNPLPIVSWNDTADSIDISAAPFVLQSASPTGGVYSGPGVIGGMFSPANAGLGEHEIVYTYTDSVGCVDTVIHRIAVVLNTAIDETILAQSVILYPNPVQHFLRLHCSKDIDWLNSIIYDSKGQQLIESSATFIDVAFLTSGIYYLQTNTNIGICWKRFTVLR